MDGMEYFLFSFDNSSDTKKVFWFCVMLFPLLGPALYCFREHRPLARARADDQRRQRSAERELHVGHGWQPRKRAHGFQRTCMSITLVAIAICSPRPACLHAPAMRGLNRIRGWT